MNTISNKSLKGKFIELFPLMLHVVLNYFIPLCYVYCTYVENKKYRAQYVRWSNFDYFIVSPFAWFNCELVTNFIFRDNLMLLNKRTVQEWEKWDMLSNMRLLWKSELCWRDWYDNCVNVLICVVHVIVQSLLSFLLIRMMKLIAHQHTIEVESRI